MIKNLILLGNNMKTKKEALKELEKINKEIKKIDTGIKISTKVLIKWNYLNGRFCGIKWSFNLKDNEFSIYPYNKSVKKKI